MGKKDSRSPALVLATMLETIFVMRSDKHRGEVWTEHEESAVEFFGRMGCTVASEAMDRIDSRMNAEEISVVLYHLVVSWFAFEGHLPGEGVKESEVELACEVVATSFCDHQKTQKFMEESQRIAEEEGDG